MDKHNVEKLEHRVIELEKLIWSIFRTLETYITFNELPSEFGDCESNGE